MQTLGDGCVGVALQGDLEIRTLVAQGAKPVGGTYRIVEGSGSTINALVLDETTPEEEQSPQSFIPKPPLAEANFLMKTLSDDDQAFMRKALLLGLENGGAMGRSPNELERLTKGEGHRFTVRQVASAGMKDGSVTLPLGSVEVEPGQRVKYFVRDGEYARKEVEAVWSGYKKNILEDTFDDQIQHTFKPTACMILPTLDRGAKLFGTKSFESSLVENYLPQVPSISGYYSNGVIGEISPQNKDAMLHGSSSLFLVFGSRTNRPIFSPFLYKQEKQKEDSTPTLAAIDLASNKLAPRLDNGELQLKRREIHSGRSISVSAVEWSVAEKAAVPTSVLEGFMWEKETEVDRFRERVPLSNLVSQWVLASKTEPPTLDWIGIASSSSPNFIVVPECKRNEPSDVSSSLRRNYDLQTLVRQYVSAGANALSVNCDAVLFGGSLEDISAARSAAGPNVPILASDLVLYPYQMYKLRLAGADAANLIVGALEGKDLLYVAKIGKSSGLQIALTVTSEVQIQRVCELESKNFDLLVLSNRDLETFDFDSTGDQVKNLLDSLAMQKFRERFPDKKVFVEGRVGIIGDDDAGEYIKSLIEKGADGSIVGGALAAINEDDGGKAYQQILDYSLSNK